MNSPLKSISIGLVTAFGLVTSAISGHAQNATATISNTGMDGSLFDYTITLHNTGSTVLDSFWYAWTLSGNNLSANISNPASALGWTDTALEGNTSISWEDSSGTHTLAAGNATTFTFESSENPTQITAGNSGQSVAYVSGTGPNTFGQNSPGSASPVFSPTLVSAPEPSTLGLMAVGLLALLVRAVPAMRPLFGILKK